MDKEITIRYQEFDNVQDMVETDRQLLLFAQEASHSAYAPYSHFHVGAAALLDDGTVVKGSNQENMAYPSGLCAERTTLFAASANYPNQKIVSLAIAAQNPDGSWVEASPCGACRQVMAEIQQRQQQPLRVIVLLNGSRVRCYPNVESLLPFLFSM